MILHLNSRSADSRAVEKLKGHSQLCDRADLDTNFVSLNGVYLNLKSNVRIEYI